MNFLGDLVAAATSKLYYEADADAKMQKIAAGNTEYDDILNTQEEDDGEVSEDAVELNEDGVASSDGDSEANLDLGQVHASSDEDEDNLEEINRKIKLTEE